MRIRVRATILATATALAAVATPPATAKIAPATLAELVQRADFIGVVRVDSVSLRIPLLVRRRAFARIVETWKGQVRGRVGFIAQPTWTCDISGAEVGEEAVVMIAGDRLVLSGRGRMPIFARDGRRLATVWSDILLPADLSTEEGPEPDYGFIRRVAVGDLGAAVAATRGTR